MKKLLFLLFTLTFLFSQAEITNVQASQRTDGSKIVDIFYTLESSNNDEFYRINIFVSFNGGINYTEISQLSGDYGNDIFPGVNKHIIWYAYEESPNLFSQDVRFKLVGEAIDFYSELNFINIPSGTFLHGGNNESVNIDYDYEIMSKEVTVGQFTRFLNIQIQLGNNPASFISENFCVFEWYDDQDSYDCNDLDSLTACIQTYSGEFHFNNFDCGMEWGYPSLGTPDEALRMSDIMLSQENNKYVVLSHPDTPIRGATIQGIYAFADFFGYDLPSLYEWEKASRGTNGNISPSGNIIVDQNQCLLDTESEEFAGNTYITWISQLFGDSGYYGGLPYYGDNLQALDCSDISPYGVYGTFTSYPEIVSETCLEENTHQIVGPSFFSESGEYNYGILDSMEECILSPDMSDTSPDNWNDYNGTYEFHSTGLGGSQDGHLSGTNLTFRLVKR